MDFPPPQQQSPFTAQPGLPGANFGPPTPAPAPAEPGKRSKGGKKDEKNPSKKVISRQVMYAGVFAAAAGLAVIGLYTGSAAPKTFVVEATGPVNSMETVGASQLKAVQVPTDYIEAGAITGTTADDAVSKALAKISGTQTRYPLHAGQQVHADGFTTTLKQLAAPLAADERLVSISANVSAAVAGSIQPGDHVDIIAADTDSKAANLILSDTEIVKVSLSDEAYNSAASQQTSEGGKNKTPSELLPGSPIPGTYVVRVKGASVVPLISADAGAKLYLALRSDKAVNIPAIPTTPKQAICGDAGC